MTQEHKTAQSEQSLDPAFVLTYGPSGSGKTTDCGYSFPNGLFIAARGALKSVNSVCGYSPAQIEVQSIDEATDTILKLQQQGGDYDAIVIDDFSFLAEQQFAMLEQKFARSSNVFAKWGALRDCVLRFRNAARYCKSHVILNCWEKGPKSSADGSRTRGGPMLSGKLPESVPAMCDIVLRCGNEPMRKPWQGVYKCEQSNNYVMKDRTDVCTRLQTAPMNLGEILRAGGYKVSRLKSLEWQEEFVEQVAQALLQGDGSQDSQIANDYYQKLLENKIDPRVARWTLRDAMDRAVIRRGTQASESLFIF